MTTKATFYHAGCPVCVEAEQSVAAALDPARYEVEIVHLGNDKARLADAESRRDAAAKAASLDRDALVAETTRLKTALEAAELDDVLRQSGPYTVFAPSDAAFARLPAGTVEALLLPVADIEVDPGMARDRGDMRRRVG